MDSHAQRTFSDLDCWVDQRLSCLCLDPDHWSWLAWWASLQPSFNSQEHHACHGLRDYYRFGRTYAEVYQVLPWRRPIFISSGGVRRARRAGGFQVIKERKEGTCGFLPEQVQALLHLLVRLKEVLLQVVEASDEDQQQGLEQKLIVWQPSAGLSALRPRSKQTIPSRLITIMIYFTLIIQISSPAYSSALTTGFYSIISPSSCLLRSLRRSSTSLGDFGTKVAMTSSF